MQAQGEQAAMPSSCPDPQRNTMDLGKLRQGERRRVTEIAKRSWESIQHGECFVSWLGTVTWHTLCNFYCKGMGATGRTRPYRKPALRVPVSQRRYSAWGTSSSPSPSSPPWVTQDRAAPTSRSPDPTAPTSSAAIEGSAPN